MVWPTMSGITVERRDHVLMTLRSPAAFTAWTFSARWSSTNGPFLRLRGIELPPCAARTTPANDELIGGLALPTCATFGLTPRRDRMATAGTFAFAASERVVDGVHGHAAC